MATYVMVAGGWAGGWAWKEVASRLRAAGHEIYTPTCTGLGEREHLAHPGIDLDTHITDIANVFRYEYLWDTILVGWSYGGMVTTGVAERLPERLRHLVYLDAWVPRDGEAQLDLFTDAATRRAMREGLLAQGIWRVPHGPPDAPRRVAHPLRTSLQPLAVRNPEAAAVPRTFIRCTGFKGGPFVEAIERSYGRAREAGWRCRELPTGHCALWTMPAETAALLLEVAAL